MHVSICKLKTNIATEIKVDSLPAQLLHYTTSVVSITDDECYQQVVTVAFC